MLSTTLHRLLLLALLAAGSGAAQAQTTPTDTAKTTAPVPTIAVAAPAAAVVPDSALAVQRLFKSRRTGSAILAFPSGYLLGAGLANISNGGAVTMALGAPLAAVSISKGSRFSKKKEETILADYRQGKPLPGPIRNRLKKKHFKA